MEREKEKKVEQKFFHECFQIFTTGTNGKMNGNSCLNMCESRLERKYDDLIDFSDMYLSGGRQQ